MDITVNQQYFCSGFKRLDVASKPWPSADRCVATRSSRVKVSAGKLTVAAVNVRDTQQPSTLWAAWKSYTRTIDVPRH
jgi:hypothetical protein